MRASGLTGRTELNGRTGTVTKYDESSLRVGVQFAPPYGLLSLKHSNLEMVDRGEQRYAMLLEKVERVRRR